MAGVLEGITVVDLSRLIAGPYSTMALADLGARVIKVEALAGEDGRTSGRRSTANPASPSCPATAARSRWRWICASRPGATSSTA
jgi:crotonobetainyl-CoA:carnitine CoA-transferase CaiB-like acyl-CoA transferase